MARSETVDRLQSLYNASVENTSVGHAIINDKGKFKDANEALCRTLGYEKSKLLNKHYSFIFPSVQHSSVEQHFNSQLEKTLPSIQFTSSLLGANGKVHSTMFSFTSVTQDSQHFVVMTAAEIDKQLNAEDENSELHNFQDIISENNSDLIYIKDEEHRILYANKTYFSLFPHESKQSIIGEVVSPTEKHDESFKNDVLAFKQGQVESIETYSDHEENEIIFHAHRFRFLNHQDRNCLLCIAKDVTDQELLIQQLKRSNDDLSQFAYVASHDLKSPLNAIEKLVSWIDDDQANANQLSEPSKEYFALIKQRVNRLGMLLDDLLSYARIGSSEYSVEMVNLGRLCGNIQSILDPANKFKIESTNENIFIARVPFELVIRNIISNSIKHHDKQEGVITLSYEEDGDHHLFKVIDDGPGIPPNLQQKATEIFQTLKPRDQVEGSGMGLALVKRIMDLFMGDFKIESDGSNGTTIVLRWPIDDH